VLITLALLGATALAPDQNTLKLDNDRFTYGPLGQARKKDEKFLPGDFANLSFDVKGLSVSNTGGISYSMAFEISKKGQDKPLQKREIPAIKRINWMGGDSLPLNVYWPIPLDKADAPGDYEMKVTVTDANTKKSATLTKAFTVAKMKLGFVRTSFTYPTEDGLPAPPVCVAGQVLLLHYSLVGFELDKEKKTDVTVTIRVLDEKGNATFKKPFVSDLKLTNKELSAPDLMRFNPPLIDVNRAGKYKIELTARCNVSKGEEVKEVLDLTVLEGK
jgi:hypothetical protein